MQLPTQLTQYIRTTYPDLRIPSSKDFTGNWAVFLDRNEVPYACWGDFNGDGKIDVALILLGQHGWRLLAFNQSSDAGYVDLKLENFPGTDEEFTRSHPPQEFHLFTVKAGKDLESDHRVLLDTPYKFDAIGFFLLSDPSSGFYYQWTYAPDSKWPDYRKKGFFGASVFGSLGD